MSLWFTFLYQPLVNMLLFTYQALGNNLGLAIIAVTVLIRAILIPLTLPGMKSAQKMQTLKPALDDLKRKHGEDKQALAKAQMDLYREHGINPFGSLLPTILQFVLLIALYQAFNDVLKPVDISASGLNQILYPFVRLPENTHLNTTFLYLDVSKPDLFALPMVINLGLIKINALPGLFLIAAAVVQFISSKMMMPATPKKETKTEDEKPEDMMMAMQQQMLYLMPLMTLVIGIGFPSGMVLYWLAISLVMIAQQLYIRKKTLQTQLAQTKEGR